MSSSLWSVFDRLRRSLWLIINSWIACFICEELIRKLDIRLYLCFNSWQRCVSFRLCFRVLLPPCLGCDIFTIIQELSIYSTGNNFSNLKYCTLVFVKLYFNKRKYFFMFWNLLTKTMSTQRNNIKTISMRPLIPEVPKFVVTDHSHPSDSMMCVPLNDSKVKAKSERVRFNITCTSLI